MSPSIVPASEVDALALLRAFNDAYSDYLVPLQLDRAQFRRTNTQNNIDLAASRVAVAGDQILGQGFLAVREERGWIAGVGVVPSARRQGIGRAVVSALMESAWEMGLETVQLEVIEDNQPARRLYEQLGFVVHRRLLIIGCEEVPDSAGPINLRTQPGFTVLDYYDAFHPVANPWQRQKESLRFMTDFSTAWVAEDQGEIVAYALGQTVDAVITFIDTAFKPGSEAAFIAMMAAIHRRHPESIVRLSNLGEDDPVWPLMQQIGYEEIFVQYEMVKTHG